VGHWRSRRCQLLLFSGENSKSVEKERRVRERRVKGINSLRWIPIFVSRKVARGTKKRERKML
jgi:hypothetical protein